MDNALPASFSLLETLQDLQANMLDRETEYTSTLDAVHPNHQDAARNLIHYLALRSKNLRDWQAQLSDAGLSSLGNCEAYAMANLEKILAWLSLLQGQSFVPSGRIPQQAASFTRSRASLQSNKRRLLGRSHRTNHTRIMVTLPSEAAEDPALVQGFMKSGMDVARINCSHDGPEAWEQMIGHVKTEAAKLNRECPIYMDLAGPKLRTGPVEVRYRKKNKKQKPIDYLLLHKGDLLHVYRESFIGRDAVLDEAGEVLEPARISVSLPAIFDAVQPGDPIWFDDGKIGAVVLEKGASRLELRITQAGMQGSKLKAEKGINLPESELDMPSLTEEDLAVLPFIARHAGLVGYSFVREAADVAFLQERLAELDRSEMGIVLKIETKKAFDQLPNILLQAMQSPSVGVMIARGDLAVEVGWERSSEVQEQLLWLCEAAHIPVIWATQVLEKLAKKGVATRSEITDAAMGSRAECIMLNKGPYITNAIRTLDNIISRMEFHQEKKKGMLRPLNVAKGFFAEMAPVR